LTVDDSRRIQELQRWDLIICIRPAVRAFDWMQVAEVTTADIVDQFGKKSFWKKMAWAIYLAAIGLATIGWLGLLSYLALALIGY
jgi:hypothetical protein